MDAKSRKLVYAAGSLLLGAGIVWGASRVCRSKGWDTLLDAPKAEVPVGVANAGFLSRIVSPESDTYSGAAGELEALADHSSTKDADPRLRELAKRRGQLFREWSQYGTQRGTAGRNPDVPGELLDRELAFWRAARDLAAELKPDWTAAADEVIRRMEKDIAERKGGR